MTTWPPILADHTLLERWRPSHPADLAELRATVALEPCEAVECIARSRESGKRELITALRPLADVARAAETPTQPREAPADVSEAIRRAREAHTGRQAAAPRGRGRKAR